MLWPSWNNVSCVLNVLKSQQQSCGSCRQFKQIIKKTERSTCLKSLTWLFWALNECLSSGKITQHGFFGVFFNSKIVLGYLNWSERSAKAKKKSKWVRNPHSQTKTQKLGECVKKRKQVACLIPWACVIAKEVIFRFLFPAVCRFDKTDRCLARESSLLFLWRKHVNSRWRCLSASPWKPHQTAAPDPLRSPRIPLRALPGNPIDICYSNTLEGVLGPRCVTTTFLHQARIPMDLTAPMCQILPSASLGRLMTLRSQKDSPASICAP